MTQDFSGCAKNKDSDQVAQAPGQVFSVLGPGGQSEGIKCSVTGSRRMAAGGHGCLGVVRIKEMSDRDK